MAKTSAFTKSVGSIGSDNSHEERSIHQSSPAWVLTFVTWDVRDTLRAIAQTGKEKALVQVRDPIVVENDCIQLSVNVNKSTLTHSVSMTLLETDVNYSTLISPGDFVFVNMLNWERDARRIVDIGRSNKLGAINGINDGFKGIFKVQGVRKSVGVTDPNTGVTRTVVRINGFAFTEFNNSIYFNPYILNGNAGSDKDKLLFAADLSNDYSQLMNPLMNPKCQDIIKFLIQAFLGKGASDKGVTNVDGIVVTPNTHFHMPTEVGIFLGVPKVKAAKDIYNYLFGIQKYEAFSNRTSLATGMNPVHNDPVNRFYYTKTPCEGQTLLRPEYWNQQKAWSIIGQYVNSPLNELYTCFRVSPEGRVMPTVVYRQIPFTSETFGTAPFNTNANVTKFLNIPRWKIATSLVISSDLGRDEAARINFVQIYAMPPSDLGRQKQDGSISGQTSSRNYAYDINDVLRSGLRPSVITTSFQDLTAFTDINVGRRWALVVGDSIIGGHLKLNGTLECAGIVDPIAVGDNLEYDGNVFHIEEIVHTCNINSATGTKTFRTSLKLSSGVSVVDTRSGLAYPEMVHTSAYKNRESNYLYGNKALPGASEEQDVSYRPITPAPSQKDLDKKNHPFAQPGQVIKPRKPRKGEDE